MDDLTEFLDRNGIRDRYGDKLEGFNPAHAFVRNIPYTDSQLSISDKKRLFDLGSVDRTGLIELTCEN
jgi:hypothetical protein